MFAVITRQNPVAATTNSDVTSVVRLR
jgi:hypothetical protein